MYLYVWRFVAGRIFETMWKEMVIMAKTYTLKADKKLLSTMTKEDAKHLESALEKMAKVEVGGSTTLSPAEDAALLKSGMFSEKTTVRKKAAKK
ncbi:MAG: hypothetical protein V1911_04375 [Candidatus Micrarchaeota archaeon]